MAFASNPDVQTPDQPLTSSGMEGRQFADMDTAKADVVARCREGGHVVNTQVKKKFKDGGKKLITITCESSGNPDTRKRDAAEASGSDASASSRRTKPSKKVACPFIININAQKDSGGK